MSLATISNGDSGLTARTKINAAIAAVSAGVATPRVLHVTSQGNDTTGNGSLNAPYATVDKALQVGDALGGAFVVEMGVGTFNSAWAEANDWPDVMLKGQGQSATTLTITCNRDVTIRGVGKSFYLNITGIGAVGTTPPQENVDQSGNDGGTGGAGPNITVVDCCGGTVTSQGGDGGQGGQGGEASGEFDTGQPGGNGGTGGNGGIVTLVNSRFATVQSVPGAGGAGGIGGSGGGGSGADGAAGSTGLHGWVQLLSSVTGDVHCDQLYWGCSNVASLVAGVVGSDYGGNSNMPLPSF